MAPASDPEPTLTASMPIEDGPDHPPGEHVTPPPLENAAAEEAQTGTVSRPTSSSARGRDGSTATVYHYAA